MMKESRQTDLMAMNVTWSDEDLKLYKNLKNLMGVEEATIFTIAKVVIFAMAIVAHRTFYKMMKRLPGRAINNILYSHMVRFKHIYPSSLVNSTFGNKLC